MAACRSIWRVLFILFTVSSSFGQESPPPPKQTAAATPDNVALNQLASVEVPSLPAEGIGAPLFCDPDGRILLRLAMPDTGVEDPVSIAPDGKTVVRFNKEKINDIPQPVLVSVFLGGSDIYVLTSGHTPLGYETKWRTSTGEVQSHQASKSSTFVAHFGHDGTYLGAVALDMPFHPLHLGVFENGDFLIAGAEPSTSEPRVAIVGSNGQLRRLIEE